MSDDNKIYCNECKKDITNDRIKPKGYCWDCCMILGNNAEKVFLRLIEDNPKLVEGFKTYKFNSGLKTSAIMLD